MVVLLSLLLPPPMLPLLLFTNSTHFTFHISPFRMMNSFHFTSFGECKHLCTLYNMLRNVGKNEKLELEQRGNANNKKQFVQTIKMCTVQVPFVWHRLCFWFGWKRLHDGSNITLIWKPPSVLTWQEYTTKNVCRLFFLPPFFFQWRWWNIRHPSEPAHTHIHPHTHKVFMRVSEHLLIATCTTTNSCSHMLLTHT